MQKIFAPRIIRNWKTRDVAFTFRMGAGFAGEVNRTHPASIEPCLQDPTNPVLGFGFGVVVNTAANSVRQMASGDTAVGALYGIAVRPFPTQQSTSTQAFGAVALGAVTPPAAGAIDVLKIGYIMVPVVGNPTKGGAAYLWVAASSGPHVQGGFEAVSPGGSGSGVLTNVVFNGPADANGFAEVIIRD